ncbi:MazG nucleotide pyrophosphohydrolase domain-containing protein [Symbiobacterium terraclitae]|uniref:MazG nucleotide pyrophosphohydrolase domain-containing protein n=1 Tax=Symbiobacterium terraclitae TaxID=557451 RepID=UPI0035B5101F
MRLDGLQQRTADLSERAWPDWSADPAIAARLLALMLEEAGELAQVVRKRAGPRLGHPGEAAATLAEIEDELGDCLFLLARIANATGASLEAAAKRVTAKIERRIAGAAY